MKSILEVEIFCTAGKGMSQQDTDASLFCDYQGDILKHALPLLIYSKPSPLAARK
ncbi:MAG: hypothetical protein GXP18_12485 [Gammaproteobacteria bacterium]|nr:hypothetical protein [Gammaproteobacteria bacterium]